MDGVAICLQTKGEMIMGVPKDYTGKKYGMLTQIRRLEKSKKCSSKLPASYKRTKTHEKHTRAFDVGKLQASQKWRNEHEHEKTAE